jgi:hypothetical protein
MMWQFGELGYDIDINFNGRTGNKPLPWGEDGLGYYENEFRQYVYDAFAAIINLRTQNSELFDDNFFTGDLSGSVKNLVIDHPAKDLVLVGNFGLEEATDVSIPYTKTGTWFDFFSGEELSIDNTDQTVNLKPGEFYLYSDQRLSEGFPGVVEIYQNPVNISPASFNLEQEITITFDATKSFPDGTDGLVGIDQVFLYSGVVTSGINGEELELIVEDGEMTSLGDDRWEITLTPRDFYEVPASTEVFRLGMYFTDASGDHVGKGFRNTTIYTSVNPDGSIVTVNPERFFSNQEITITFNPKFGSGALVGADKVYIHSGVVLNNTNEPGGSDWSNVVGNWGADDGVGAMTKNGEVWEINLTPVEYYNIGGSDSIYWLSMVFRNADGTTQTNATDSYDNLFVNGGDIFYRVLPPERALNVEIQNPQTIIYPNPVLDFIRIRGVNGNPDQIRIRDVSGKVLWQEINPTEETINIRHLSNGLYLLELFYDQKKFQHKILINR